jgi:phytoene synthase
MVGQYCMALVHDSDHDRYLATLFAPADRREALFALYAFDIEISRIRDLARERMPGEIRLQWWREVLQGERAGEAAANPVAAALVTAIAEHGLASEKLVGLAEAHRFDVYNEAMSTVSALQSYASSTAGTIFECATRILGATGQVAIAQEAGQAQTFCDTLIFLPRHASRGQLFLPLDLLQQYAAAPEDIFAMRATPELQMALAELRLRTRHHLIQVAKLSADIPETIRPAFLHLAALGPFLAAMERASYQPFRPPEIPRWRRQWCIWRAAKSPERIGR